MKPVLPVSQGYRTNRTQRPSSQFCLCSRVGYWTYWVGYQIYPKKGRLVTPGGLVQPTKKGRLVTPGGLVQPPKKGRLVTPGGLVQPPKKGRLVTPGGLVQPTKKGRLVTPGGLVQPPKKGRLVTPGGLVHKINSVKILRQAQISISIGLSLPVWGFVFGYGFPAWQVPQSLRIKRRASGAEIAYTPIILHLRDFICTIFVDLPREPLTYVETLLY